MRRMLKKDLTRFMSSLSSVRQVRESKRKVVLAGCAGKGYEIESQPGTDTKTIYIFFFSKNMFMQACTDNNRGFLVAIAKAPLKEVTL